MESARGNIQKICYGANFNIAFYVGQKLTVDNETVVIDSIYKDIQYFNDTGKERWIIEVKKPDGTIRMWRRIKSTNVDESFDTQKGKEQTHIYDGD